MTTSTLSLQEWKSIITSSAGRVSPRRWRIDTTSQEATGVSTRDGSTMVAARTAQGYWRVIVTSADGEAKVDKLTAVTFGLLETERLRRAA